MAQDKKNQDKMPDRLDTEQTEEAARKLLKERELATAEGVFVLEDYFADIYLLTEKPNTVLIRFYRKDLEKPPEPREKHAIWEG